MIDLIATAPAETGLPLQVGALSLTQIRAGRLSLLSAYKGQQNALDATLRAAHALGWPGPNQTLPETGASDHSGRIIWFGREQALLIGPDPDPALAALAAVTDQSDAWATLRLAGPQADQVLARLVPVDLRRSAFAPGATMRTQISHLMASITRTPQDAFDILVFRSMTATLIHDLKSAMVGVAARG